MIGVVSRLAKVRLGLQLVIDEKSKIRVGSRFTANIKLS
jgi:hypothetical protein